MLGLRISPDHQHMHGSFGADMPPSLLYERVLGQCTVLIMSAAVLLGWPGCLCHA
jgi:hypothetical protein